MQFLSSIHLSCIHCLAAVIHLNDFLVLVHSRWQRLQILRPLQVQKRVFLCVYIRANMQWMDAVFILFLHDINCEFNSFIRRRGTVNVIFLQNIMNTDVAFVHSILIFHSLVSPLLLDQIHQNVQELPEESKNKIKCFFKRFFFFFVERVMQREGAGCRLA